MSEVANKIERSANLDSFMATTFVVSRKGKSGFKKEGTGENGIAPEYLTTGKTLFVEPISRLYMGKGNGYMPTQYVIGAATTYVNDYWEDKDGKLVPESLTISKAQAEKAGYSFRPGLKSQGFDLKEEYARSVTEGICFTFGQLSINPNDTILIKFINEHEQNKASAGWAENKDPKRLNLFTFEPLIPEQKAAKSKVITNFDADVEALNFVQKLRVQGDAGFTYKEESLNAILNILGDGKGLGHGEVIQKFDIVAKYAKRDGAAFMDLVNTAFNEYRVSAGMAETLKVLKLTATEAILTEGTKSNTILTFKKGAQKEECLEDLVIYFLSGDQGQSVHADMMRCIELAKLKSQS